MLGKKRWMFFKKLKKETTSSSPSSPRSPSPPSVRRWKPFWSAAKWRRLRGIQLSFLHNVLFKVVSVFEAVVLVSTLAFFYLFCGCHF